MQKSEHIYIVYTLLSQAYMATSLFPRRESQARYSALQRLIVLQTIMLNVWQTPGELNAILDRAIAHFRHFQFFSHRPTTGKERGPAHYTARYCRLKMNLKQTPVRLGALWRTESKHGSSFITHCIVNRLFQILVHVVLLDTQPDMFNHKKGGGGRGRTSN